MTAEPDGDSRGDLRSEREAFWRFSLALYGEPGVAPALIALQDRDGCDVNLVLLALWFAAGGQAIGAADLAVAERAAAPLRDGAIVGLRALRRRLRGSPDPDLQSLRRRIGSLEIAAERLAQGRLVAALPRRGGVAADRAAVAAANLAACLGAAAAAPEAAALRQALDRFMRRR